MERIATLRDRGCSAIGVNSYLRCINAYLRWAHQEGHRSPALDGGKLRHTNVILVFHALGDRLKITGVSFSFHTMQHTFAVNYVRAGGDVFRLQRIHTHQFGDDVDVCEP